MQTSPYGRNNMKLGFYYHVPIVVSENGVKIPSYFGVFLDALASEIDVLYIMMHKARPHEMSEADYVLKSSNIHFIDLGIKTKAWYRTIFHRKILKKPLQVMNQCDLILVRAPSPLAPYFYKYLNKVKLVYMVVGDYAESVKQTKVRTLREFIVNQYVLHNDFMFRKRIQKTDIVVNSPALLKKYKSVSKSIQLIRTTTLLETDLYNRADTCEDSRIQLLYTGRIDPLKGLVELIEAVAIIKKEYPNLILNIVGWELSGKKHVEKQLCQIAEANGILSDVIFHGKKKVGDELNSFYRTSDIYVIPSYEEGFPRTIWEAMANSLPVIATRVGGIPEYLTHKKDAYLIPPKSVKAVVEAIRTVIHSKDLRQTLIKNGMEQAKETTLPNQTKKLVAHLKSLI
jgi:glycosyltransferase involved in cell wall biosynthesis